MHPEDDYNHRMRQGMQQPQGGYNPQMQQPGMQQGYPQQPGMQHPQGGYNPQMQQPGMQQGYPQQPGMQHPQGGYDPRMQQPGMQQRPANYIDPIAARARRQQEMYQKANSFNNPQAAARARQQHQQELDRQQQQPQPSIFSDGKGYQQPQQQQQEQPLTGLDNYMENYRFSMCKPSDKFKKKAETKSAPNASGNNTVTPEQTTKPENKEEYETKAYSNKPIRGSKKIKARTIGKTKLISDTDIKDSEDISITYSDKEATEDALAKGMKELGPSNHSYLVTTPIYLGIGQTELMELLSLDALNLYQTLKNKIELCNDREELASLFQLDDILTKEVNDFIAVGKDYPYDLTIDSFAEDYTDLLQYFEDNNILAKVKTDTGERINLTAPMNEHLNNFIEMLFSKTEAVLISLNEDDDEKEETTTKDTTESSSEEPKSALDEMVDDMSKSIDEAADKAFSEEDEEEEEDDDDVKLTFESDLDTSDFNSALRSGFKPQYKVSNRDTDEPTLIAKELEILQLNLFKEELGFDNKVPTKYVKVPKNDLNRKVLAVAAAMLKLKDVLTFQLVFMDRTVIEFRVNHFGELYIRKIV
jgi:hypothetical protein